MHQFTASLCSKPHIYGRLQLNTHAPCIAWTLKSKLCRVHARQFSLVPLLLLGLKPKTFQIVSLVLYHCPKGRDQIELKYRGRVLTPPRPPPPPPTHTPNLSIWPPCGIVVTHGMHTDFSVILALLLTFVCNVCSYCLICSFVRRWHLLSSLNVHRDIFWWFCLQTTSLSLCYYALAWVADMVATLHLLVWSQNVNCNVPIG